MDKVIIIQTENNPIVTQVENFSKENCINAIARALKIDAGIIQQLSASMGYGIYGVNELCPSLESIATNPISDNGYFHTLQVEYGDFVK